MDFLDPRKRNAYRIRLIVGYILIGTVIGLATYILANAANGFGINTKTGEIVQSGLLYVDSKPGGATINLSGTSSRSTTTSARLNLPAGNYTLKISKSGYRDWQSSFTLEEHTIERYVYPFLFPNKPVSSDMHSYSSLPPLVMQSPDQHWLLVQNPSTTSGSVSFDQYDTTKPTQTGQPLNLPVDLLTNVDQPGSSFTLVEWSTDNIHLLLRHDYQGGNEFIIVDRTDPTASLNVNKLFGINPSEVALRNRKVDQLYIYDKSAQTLQVGNTGKGSLDPAFLKKVLAFKSYGSDLLTYVTDNQMPAGQAQARIWNNGPTYPLYTFMAGSSYLIDAAQYSGHWYYIAGSNTDDRVNIFEDPLNDIKDPAIGKAIPTLTLRVLGANKESFSTNTRFVEIENGQSFGVYDFETQTRYQYSLKVPLAESLHWMDGHRLIGNSGGTVFVTDYDGTNQQLLVPTAENDGGYFSADFNHLFTLSPGTSDSSVNLKNVDMRAGTDLP